MSTKFHGLNLPHRFSRYFTVCMLIVMHFSISAQVPVANFNATSTAGCATFFVNFQDQSTGNPAFWNWDLGNGQLSNLQNPVGIYGKPGKYTITLVVRNANGTNAITKTDYITVYPSPNPAFTSDITTACLPATVQFTDQSTAAGGGAITQWQWDFGDGTTSTQQNPQKTYTDVGFYSVSIRVTSSTGCVGATSKPRYIRVVSGMIPDFDFKAPGTCRPPFATSFTNLTSGPGVLDYQWNFGDGNTSTQTNPIANYAAAGTYTVQLTAHSEFGCAGTIQKSVPISGTNTSFTGSDSVCLNTPVNFQNTSSPAPVTTLWDFGNGRQSSKLNDTVSYSAPGTYIVKLVNNYGACTDSTIKTIYARPKPVVDFTANTVLGCKAPLTVNFQDLSPDAVTWQWTFGDGATSTLQNPGHTYATEGLFDVRLVITSSKGCSDTITKPAFIRIARPIITLSNVPNGGCSPFTITPSASVNALDGVASYFWDYGDGFTFTSTVPNGVNHTYPGVGNYDFKLRITTNGGCVDSAVVINGIQVGTPPGTVDFSASPTPVCGINPVTFTDLSTGTIDRWTWNFGDGSTSNAQNPTHAYTDTGYFPISLSIYNMRCGQLISKPAYVRVIGPITGFTYSISACTNKLQVTFTDTTKVDNSLGAPTYSWDFGDGTTSTLKNPVHTFPGLNSYTVSLTVFNGNGSCSGNAAKVIQLVGDLADFAVSRKTACIRDTILVSAINSNPTHIVSYEWSVNGAPFFTSGPSIIVSFTAARPYSIVLRTTDINGCVDVKTVDTAVTIVGPKAAFTSNKGSCKNAPVTFNDGSTGTGLQKWIWDFGDGNTQTFNAPPFSHAYADTGLYKVSLTVEDIAGCRYTDSTEMPVRITNLKADFTADYPTVCPDTLVTFKNLSSDTAATFSWDFGDGATSNLFGPKHGYPGVNNTYTVRLYVTDSVGCTDSSIKVSYITTKKPVAAFDAVDTVSICPLLETKFTSKATDYNTLLWDFGDGSGPSTLTAPRHFYNVYGIYTAKLYAIGFGGCLDSASRVISVYDPFSTTSLVYSPITACNSLLVDFTLTPTPNVEFTFYAGDGFVDSSGATTLQHLYSSLGFYAPYVILQDKLDCRIQVGGPNTIRIIGAEPFFGVDKNTFCDSGTVNFANYTLANDPIVGSNWDFGDGSTSTTKNPSHTYLQPGTYVAGLTATTQAGCTQTILDTILVYGTPKPIIVADSVVCIGENLDLVGILAIPDTAITWSWNYANGTSNNQNTSTSYSSAGNYTLQLEASNKLGCKGTDSKTVFVPPIPVINIGGNPVIPVGTGINLPITYGPDISTYNWIPATGLSCTDCPVPFANPKYSTKYKISVQDIYGCTNSNSVTVTVICNDKNFYMPNTFSPNNDGNNDIFYPRGSSLARIASLRIFNRWGELVFERRDFAANDATLGWNGTYKGKPAAEDVYVYSIEFICDNAAIIPYKGNVTLIR